jgi:hypothetical protein
VEGGGGKNNYIVGIERLHFPSLLRSTEALENKNLNKNQKPCGTSKKNLLLLPCT